MFLLGSFFVLLALTQGLNGQYGSPSPPQGEQQQTPQPAPHPPPKAAPQPPQQPTPQPSPPAAHQGSACAEVQRGQPIILNAQPVDKQNIGDQCYSQPIQCDANYEFRYLDGKCNNLKHKSWGMAGHTTVRLQSAVYSTKPGDPPGTPRLSVENKRLQSSRVISNCYFTDHDFASSQYTLAFMVLSQFFTHDVLLLKFRNPPSDGCCKNGGTARKPLTEWDKGCIGIDIPSNDRFYSQFQQICCQIARAQFSSDFGCQLPEIENACSVTSYFDGSVVYGTTDEIAKQLRLGQDGKLKFQTTQDGQVFLPQDQPGSPFKGSDVRANQHAQLTVVQVMALRIHNKLCDELKKINGNNPKWQNDELLYQTAKKILTGMLQHIIFGRFSEILFGPECAKAYGFTEPGCQGYYDGYDEEVNAGTTAEFEHVAFRAFHSLVEGDVKLYDENRKEAGSFRFSDWYINQGFVKEPGNFDKILIGMSTQPMQNFDRFYSTEITQEFFKQFNQGKFGSDLASVDVERGRDCGIQPYIYYATLAGWPVVKSFDELSDRMDAKMIDRLKKTYKDVRDIDAILGAILEFPYGKSLFGKTLHYVIAEQFRRYKFGDSFFYSFKGRGQFTPGQLAAIRTTSLSLLICWGSDGIQRMQADAFSIPGNQPMVECRKLIGDFTKQLWANWADNGNQPPKQADSGKHPHSGKQPNSGKQPESGPYG